jgi:hypothetical protein
MAIAANHPARVCVVRPEPVVRVVMRRRVHERAHRAQDLYARANPVPLRCGRAVA